MLKADITKKAGLYLPFLLLVMNERNMLTDEQLIEQLKSGETDAIDELYRRYALKLYAFCFSITHSTNIKHLLRYRRIKCEQYV